MFSNMLYCLYLKVYGFPMAKEGKMYRICVACLAVAALLVSFQPSFAFADEPEQSLIQARTGFEQSSKKIWTNDDLQNPVFKSNNPVNQFGTLQPPVSSDQTKEKQVYAVYLYYTRGAGDLWPGLSLSPFFVQPFYISVKKGSTVLIYLWNQPESGQYWAQAYVQGYNAFISASGPNGLGTARFVADRPGYFSIQDLNGGPNFLAGQLIVTDKNQEPPAKAAAKTNIQILEITTVCNGQMLAQPSWCPTEMRAKLGQKMTLLLYNNLLWSHGWAGLAIDEFHVSAILTPGSRAEVEFTPDRAGSFEYYDPVNPYAVRGTLFVDP